MNKNFDFSDVKEADRKDILELNRRISDYHTGKEDEERFKLYRLTRGVYGQRQTGVQMFRTKIPFGKLTADQLVKLADVSEHYTNGNLHITTRQNIQMHYVKLTDSPAIWTELASAGVTAREACGNTVRNITASAHAGIDPDELFDVTPYVQATFEYFLRNPICQEMGRKIKIAFSASDKDSAFTYFHDFGFIPRIQEVDGKQERGFKVVVGGGLGAVSMVAQTAYEFLPEDQLIPFVEAGIRIFDRFGEREKRMKARMKFLLKKLGLDGLMELIRAEWTALPQKSYPIDYDTVPTPPVPHLSSIPEVAPVDEQAYPLWEATNVYAQKQEGYFAVQVRVPLGDVKAPTARKLADIARKYAADDIRLTVNQGLLFRFVPKSALPAVFNELRALNLAKPGFDTTVDITACPGTDTCALGVTNSTGLAGQLEEVIREEYPALIEERNLHIKISGCMNSCGQHMAAEIGFHGSSIKKKELVVPAMQVVIGGGVDPQGKAYVAEKVIKLPTKRIPDALRTILTDYEDNAAEGTYFNDYYYKQGKRYFYDILKELADVESLTETDLFDWGQDHLYKQEIGVGECAGVTLDLVSTILQDASEKLEQATEANETGAFANAIYYSYTSFIVAAKALLLSNDHKCNTHSGILKDFQTYFIAENKLETSITDFSATVLQINQNEPAEEFAKAYTAEARAFVKEVIRSRERALQSANGSDKLVVENYYKA